MKICSKCGVLKDPSEFNWAKRAKGERKARCRVCTKSDSKAYNDRPDVKAHHAAYHVGYVQRSGVHLRISASQAAWHEANRDRRNAEATERYKNYRATGSLSPILGRLRGRAKRLGIPFYLSNEDLVIPEFCPVLGIRLSGFYTGRKGPIPESISIDRIIPRIGYVKGNVRVMSHRANTLINNGTLKEHEKVVAFLRNHQPASGDS